MKNDIIKIENSEKNIEELEKIDIVQNQEFKENSLLGNQYLIVKDAFNTIMDRADTNLTEEDKIRVSKAKADCQSSIWLYLKCSSGALILLSTYFLLNKFNKLSKK